MWCPRCSEVSSDPWDLFFFLQAATPAGMRQANATPRIISATARSSRKRLPVGRRHGELDDDRIVIGAESRQAPERGDVDVRAHEAMIDGNAEQREERRPREARARARARVPKTGRVDEILEVRRIWRQVEIAGDDERAVDARDERRERIELAVALGGG